MTRCTETLLERRDRQRFPLRREVRYRVAGSGLEAGSGTTVDLSKTGLAFLGDEPLPLGAAVEFSVSWPTEREVTPLRLIATGRVVRSDGPITACTIDEFAFRTEPQPGKIDLASLVS